MLQLNCCWTEVIILLGLIGHLCKQLHYTKCLCLLAETLAVCVLRLREIYSHSQTLNLIADPQPHPYFDLEYAASQRTICLQSAQRSDLFHRHLGENMSCVSPGVTSQVETCSL